HVATLLDSGALLVTGGRSTSAHFGSSIGEAEQLEVFAAGARCVAADDCASGICDQGVCCLAACATTCHSCSAGTGRCDVVASADDPSSCTGENTCDAAGACKKKNGGSCSAAADCASGFCVDGICCNAACSGTCEACDGLAKGTCEPVV